MPTALERAARAGWQAVRPSSARRVLGRWSGLSWRRSCDGSLIVRGWIRRRIGRSAGERQEHLVEARLAAREVADADPQASQLGQGPTDALGHLAGAVPG